jgi:hypothetical protein
MQNLASNGCPGFFVLETLRQAWGSFHKKTPPKGEVLRLIVTWLGMEQHPQTTIFQ